MDISLIIEPTESSLDISSLTSMYGLQSFKYERSHFVEYIKDNIRLSNSDVFYDLGSGYGEVLFELANKFSSTKFYGIEIVKERVEVATSYVKQLGLNNVKFINGSILTTDISKGNYFFIFNPLFSFQYPALIDVLAEIGSIKKIYILAEARACDYFAEQNWLQQVQDIRIDYLRKLCIYSSL